MRSSSNPVRMSACTVSDCATDDQSYPMGHDVLQGQTTSPESLLDGEKSSQYSPSSTMDVRAADASSPRVTPGPANHCLKWVGTLKQSKKDAASRFEKYTRQPYGKETGFANLLGKGGGAEASDRELPFQMVRWRPWADFATTNLEAACTGTRASRTLPMDNSRVRRAVYSTLSAFPMTGKVASGDEAGIIVLLSLINARRSAGTTARESHVATFSGKSTAAASNVGVGKREVGSYRANARWVSPSAADASEGAASSLRIKRLHRCTT